MNSHTVKICGLQSLHSLKQLKGLSIDYIGFVFASSKRQVTAAQAAEMIEYMKQENAAAPLAVGVFMNPDQSELEQVISVAKLDVIQLHGTESAELCRWIKEELQLQVLKTASVSHGEQDFSIEEQWDPYAAYIDGLLLDTYDPLVGGGTGKTFAWQRIPPYKQWAERHGIPLMIAGGLHARNVAELLRTYQPNGVDVSSGVETNGVKDMYKISEFVERVKAV